MGIKEIVQIEAKNKVFDWSPLQGLSESVTHLACILARLQPLPTHFEGMIYICSSRVAPKLTISYLIASDIAWALQSLWPQDSNATESLDRKRIHSIWDLLWPSTSFKNQPRLSEDAIANCKRKPIPVVYFLMTFLILYGAATAGKSLPTHIPLHLRVGIDHRAAFPSRVYKRHFSYTSLLFKNPSLTAINVAIYLELVISRNTNGLEQASHILEGVIKKKGTFDGFRLLEPDDLSNLLVTFIEQFLKCYGTDYQTDQYYKAINFFKTICSLSRQVPDRLFKDTVSKFNGLEVPLCFALFLDGLSGDDEWMACQLYKSLEHRYTNLCDRQHGSAKSKAIGMIVTFLSLPFVRRYPFFASIHHLMLLLKLTDEWEYTWHALDQKEGWNQQNRSYSENMANYTALVTLYQNDQLCSLT